MSIGPVAELIIGETSPETVSIEGATSEIDNGLLLGVGWELSATFCWYVTLEGIATGGYIFGLEPGDFETDFDPGTGEFRTELEAGGVGTGGTAGGTAGITEFFVVL